MTCLNTVIMSYKRADVKRNCKNISREINQGKAGLHFILIDFLIIGHTVGTAALYWINPSGLGDTPLRVGHIFLNESKSIFA